MGNYIPNSLSCKTPLAEEPRYLTDQLITYIGNKRALLPFIGIGVERVRKALGKERLDFADSFAGSGVVSRYFKQFARRIFSNDLEKYSYVAGKCYLANKSELPTEKLVHAHSRLQKMVREQPVKHGIIRRMYAPQDDKKILPGERVFYTVENAIQLDSYRTYLDTVEEEIRHYLLAPLLSEASVHANTSGVFKGFYKDKNTGIGCFGGAAGDALTRILGRIELHLPVLSNFSCDSHVTCMDANDFAKAHDPVDLAYFDPPYNQHPYGANYFMLNLLCDYKEPTNISKVSGIPDNWNRSMYNKRHQAEHAFAQLVNSTRAKFILVSFNDEGFISPEAMTRILASRGEVERFDTQYNTFRGCRNLDGRSIHVREQLFLLRAKD